MKILHRIAQPARRPVRVEPRTGPGHGLDAVVTLVIFFGVGFGIDRLAGTTPVFMVVMTVLGAVGLFATFKYRYDRTMEGLEAEHRSKTRRVVPAGAEVEPTDDRSDRREVA